ncbi:hypothetical protein LIX60_03545 [Streptomyces sp. S07_1.15]|uniref:hypothetical protein n=1 Tax=Streptomyces sp. S07_1.15 TaxID=2873925 RepID=UPI001D13FB70|nr:hypothetical protein [Streptomyces sp. S07_1.15]MCC3650584.1 hypothetical protein [Streptomyces sp. S07_1.15]
MSILGSLVAAAMFSFVGGIAAGAIKVSDENAPWIFSSAGLAAVLMIVFEYRNLVQSGAGPSSSGASAPLRAGLFLGTGTVLGGGRKRKLLSGTISCLVGLFSMISLLALRDDRPHLDRLFLLLFGALLLIWGIIDLIGKRKLRLEFTATHLALVRGRYIMAMPWSEIDDVRIVPFTLAPRLLVKPKPASILRTTEPTMSAIARTGLISIDLRGTKIKARAVEAALLQWKP